MPVFLVEAHSVVQHGFLLIRICQILLARCGNSWQEQLVQAQKWMGAINDLTKKKKRAFVNVNKLQNSLSLTKRKTKNLLISDIMSPFIVNHQEMNHQLLWSCRNTKDFVVPAPQLWGALLLFSIVVGHLNTSHWGEGSCGCFVFCWLD